ncbi:hypothetical protein SPLC1_S533180 [Arthrospira platensis C1]|nr:hypothetical protein SPLC1_S533180 [Arthrospira platensis C1]
MCQNIDVILQSSREQLFVTYIMVNENNPTPSQVA